MASKDVSNGKMVPKAKTNTSSSSSVPPRKYGAHSGLKFKFNLNKHSISKSTIDVGNRNEKKLPRRVDEGHPGLKTNWERDTKMKSTTCKIEIEKPHNQEDEALPALKTNLERNSKKNPGTSESQTEKEKPSLQEDEAHPSLKIKLEKDSTKKSAVFKSKIEKKPPPAEYEGNPGQKEKLEKDSKKKSSSFQCKIEKEKPPPRKYGAHSGLKFKFNTEKNVIPKTFIFESLTRDTNKGGTASIDTVTAQMFPNQIHKEVYNAPDEKEYASVLEENMKTLRVSGSTHEVAPEKNVQIDSETSKEKENANICRNSATSLRELKHQPQTSKITNSQACNILKPEIASKASNLSSENVRQIKGRSLITKESPIPRYSDATRVDTITVQMVGSQTHKEKSRNLGLKKHAPNLEKDEKTLRDSEFLYDVVVEENIQDDFEILRKKDISNLCSNSVASFRDLKHQRKSPKITKSHACNTLKRPEIASKDSNLSSSNVPQISKGRPSVTKEPPIPRFSDATRVGTIKVQMVENQTHKEHYNSGVKKYATTLEEDGKTPRESEFFYDVVVEENVQDDEFQILRKKEIANLCSNSVASFSDLKHQHKSRNITKSHASDALKHFEIASKASKLSSLNIPQFSKGRPPVTKELPISRYLDAPRVGTITMQEVENQRHKEERHKSGVKKYASTLEEDERTLRDTENVQDDYEILSKKESASFRSSSVASFRVMQHQHPSSWIPNNQACNILKNPEITSKPPNLSSLNIRQISDYKQVAEEETMISRSSDATSVSTATTQVVDFLTYKEERYKSGTGTHLSILKDDLKTAQKSDHNSISMKNVQNTEISTDNESEDLCNKVATSLRVLQPHLQTLKISKYKANDTSKPQEILSKASKLPILNAQQNSRRQPTKLEELMTPASPKKYGFHSGLRFHFKEKKATPVDIAFNRTPSVSKDKCFKNGKRDPAF